MGLLSLFGLRSGAEGRSGTVLRSDRLLLRPPRVEDYEAWSALRRESRAFLQPWEPRWPSDHLTRPSFRRRVRWAGNEAEADRAYSFLAFLRDDEALVGGITLSNVRRGPARSGSLGYWVGERHARRGYMDEAVGRMEDFAFDDLGLVRLEAACLEENDASRRLLERRGYASEGIVRGYLEVDGEVRDHVLYAKLAEEVARSRAYRERRA